MATAEAYDSQRTQTNEPAADFPSAMKVGKVLRRPDREQGISLEILGHAIEYLVDSRMFSGDIPYTKTENEAIKILSAASREVFQECVEVVPLRARMSGWLRSHLSGSMQTGSMTH